MNLVEGFALEQTVSEGGLVRGTLTCRWNATLDALEQTESKRAGALVDRDVMSWPDVSSVHVLFVDKGSSRLPNLVRCAGNLQVAVTHTPAFAATASASPPCSMKSAWAGRTSPTPVSGALDTVGGDAQAKSGEEALAPEHPPAQPKNRRTGIRQDLLAGTPSWFCWRPTASRVP